ncbi:Uncharacterized protein OBRU01_16981 [Operophtera brumata]|uniref:Uncharacterized protein n=1 Tax=Operophtera brumata TaxID=104452 RepID=A0A0L7L1M7_OPEBR|nr:Uncharacterized protein OBRU01_16981 [Operophtera brumata]
MTEEDAENSEARNFNETAVCSFRSIGAGHAGLEQVSASLGIPYKICLNISTLNAMQRFANCGNWQNRSAWKKLQRRNNGDVTADGVPKITVVADACGPKRSYRKTSGPCRVM